ncbi:MAG TPA: hypothetical protein PLI07_11215, partial [Candidatus Hydrogenedentes bacterium]|nr:hypothetical protein [Candidatus Hydrogenedentota bacterium]
MKQFRFVPCGNFQCLETSFQEACKDGKDEAFGGGVSGINKGKALFLCIQGVVIPDIAGNKGIYTAGNVADWLAPAPAITATVMPTT